MLGRFSSSNAIALSLTATIASPGEHPSDFCDPANGDPITGCINSAVEEHAPCTDDGFGCTDDVCSAGLCTHVPVPENCSDGNYCTDDVCDPATGDPVTGCLNPPVSAGTACPEDAITCTRDECDGAGTCTHNLDDSR